MPRRRYIYQCFEFNKYPTQGEHASMTWRESEPWRKTVHTESRPPSRLSERIEIRRVELGSRSRPERTNSLAQLARIGLNTSPSLVPLTDERNPERKESTWLRLESTGDPVTCFQNGVARSPAHVTMTLVDLPTKPCLTGSHFIAVAVNPSKIGSLHICLTMVKDEDSSKHKVSYSKRVKKKT